MTPTELLIRLMQWLVLLMQTSIVVPMVVVWWRKRHFSAPIRVLSWYVYLSAFCVLGARLLYPAYLAKNHWFLIGFNMGKVMLLGLMYYLALEPGWARKLIMPVILLASIGVFGLAWYDSLVTVGISRAVQCTLLASLAIAYMAQIMTQPNPKPASQDPLWLVSIGQLLYSAGTVTSFSLDLMPVSDLEYYIKFSFVSISGLAFNYFLTLAFLRAQPLEQPAPEAEISSLSQLVQP